MIINTDLIYPVGSIYMTTSTVSPAVLFGGTWERIKGRCIVGVDEGDTDFGTVSKIGGEKTHKLTVAEMPSHNHGFKRHTDTGSYFTITSVSAQNTTGYGFSTDNTGGDGAHNNLQPYYTSYIWRRTA